VTRPPADTFASLLGCAHTLADASGKVILPHFRRQMDVENKAQGGDFDPVTAADRGAERVISKMLARSHPHHGLTGEEYGSRNTDARYRWVVDPIDGTRSFMTGALTWGTLIGLLDGDQPLLGIMDQPYVRERFWAGAKGAYQRGPDGKTHKLRTRTCSKLSDAMLSTTHPDLFSAGKEAKGFQRIKSAVRMTRFGGDCYGYALLACGLIDLVIEVDLKPFDVIALIPIVERAGGRMTTWDGLPAAGGGRIVASGDAKLHDEVLRLLNT
jgi:histidinol phosphatase-like enzyme (inositol monophosphatase family)